MSCDWFIIAFGIHWPVIANPGFLHVLNQSLKTFWISCRQIPIS